MKGKNGCPNGCLDDEDCKAIEARFNHAPDILKELKVYLNETEIYYRYSAGHSWTLGTNDVRIWSPRCIYCGAELITPKRGKHAYED